jgi:hypothetical protein
VNQPYRVETVDAWTRRALELAPKECLSWWARADYFEMIGDLKASLPLMEEASRHAQHVDFWVEYAGHLERAGQVRQVLEAFTNAVHLARQQVEQGLLDEEAFYTIQFYRARVLLWQGQVEEGVEELSAALGIPRRESRTPASLIDLSLFYNSGLEGRSYLSMTFRDGFNGLLLGCQTLAGIRFDIRGLVQLSSAPLKATGHGLPEKASVTVAAQPCQRIHFLHGADRQTGEGTRIGIYVIRYAEGGTAEIPVVYGHDVSVWNEAVEPGTIGPKVAWKGRNNSSLNVQLFLTTWENPRADKKVEGIDLVSAMKEAAPFVVAITVE